MLNASWITNRLMVGSAPTHSYDQKDLRAAGITNVIDVRATTEEKVIGACDYEEEGLAYESFPLVEFPDDANVSNLTLASSRVLEILATNVSGKVYIHCEAGIIRSPLLVLAVLCRFGHSLAWSLERLKKLRPNVYFTADLIDDLLLALGPDEGRILM